MLFARQRLYEHGNKPGHLLACIKGRTDRNIISSLKDGKGSTALDSKQINSIMREFIGSYTLSYVKHGLYFIDSEKNKPPDECGSYMRFLHADQFNKCRL